jgi:hypothetical protein
MRVQRASGENKMKMIRFSRLLLALLLMISAPHVSQAADKSVFVSRTRAFVDEFNSSDLPNAQQLSRLQSILSTDFHRAFTAARAANDADVAAAPGDKPRFADFSFISSPEGFDGYTIANARRLSGRHVAVDVAFFDNDQGQVWRWTDRYHWVRENKVWKLDDIEYEINDASRTGRMKSFLLGQ